MINKLLKKFEINFKKKLIIYLGVFFIFPLTLNQEYVQNL